MDRQTGAGGTFAVKDREDGCKKESRKEKKTWIYTER